MGNHGGNHGGHHGRQAVVSGHGGLERGRTSGQYFVWRRMGQLTVGSLRLVMVAALPEVSGGGRGGRAGHVVVVDRTVAGDGEGGEAGGGQAGHLAGRGGGRGGAGGGDCRDRQDVGGLLVARLGLVAAHVGRQRGVGGRGLVQGDVAHVGY